MSPVEAASQSEETCQADWSRLMARAQGGDAAAYSRLLDEIVPYLRSLARRRLQSADDIEDAVQDTLLTLHAIRHAYDPQRPFGPWLVAIAGRRIADRVRKRTRIATREVPLGSEHETLLPDLTNIYENAAECRLLLRAVEALPVAQRRAITLLKLRELSLKEAALDTGTSVAALKVAVHRAMKALRAALALK